MQRSNPLTLFATFMLGVVATIGFEWLQVSNGRAILPPSASMGIVLGALGILILYMAWPIKRATSGKPGAKKVNPFVAVRIAFAARAGAITGALFAGLGVGLLIFGFTLPVFPTVILWGSISTIIGSALLTACSLIAEWFCVVPPDDFDPDQETDSVKGTAPKTGPSDVATKKAHQ
ncbi:MAG: DUF3180 domain-containing protein [Microbacteriaceae bacterium]|nr:DUF3180 domain-containing protein [Microbacteriaceae bacterium]